MRRRGSKQNMANAAVFQRQLLGEHMLFVVVMILRFEHLKRRADNKEEHHKHDVPAGDRC